MMRFERWYDVLFLFLHYRRYRWLGRGKTSSETYVAAMVRSGLAPTETSASGRLKPVAIKVMRSSSSSCSSITAKDNVGLLVGGFTDDRDNIIHFMQGHIQATGNIDQYPTCPIDGRLFQQRTGA